MGAISSRRNAYRGHFLMKKQRVFVKHLCKNPVFYQWESRCGGDGGVRLELWWEVWKSMVLGSFWGVPKNKSSNYKDHHFWEPGLACEREARLRLNQNDTPLIHLEASGSMWRQLQAARPPTTHHRHHHIPLPPPPPPTTTASLRSALCEWFENQLKNDSKIM